MIEVLDPVPHSAALNMAIDEVLLQAATAPLLRVYRWARPAVSFGYFTKFAEVAHLWPGRDRVRRWTGGGVVEHGADVTYTLVVPRGCPFFSSNAGESYRRIHACLATLFGPAVALAGAPQEKVSEACFENSVRHDVLLAGRKVAGAAQRRTQWGLLHQGSVQEPEFTGRGAEGRGAEGIADAFASRVRRRELSATELGRAEEIAALKYSSEAWLRRF